MQQKLKNCIDSHLGETCDLVNKRNYSDIFARHFANIFLQGAKIACQDVRLKTQVGVLWEGNPISCMKSFGRLNFSLCMKEWLHILKRLCTDPTTLINSSNELYGACRHYTRFHRYKSSIPVFSADNDRTVQKRVDMLIPVNTSHSGNKVSICPPILECPSNPGLSPSLVNNIQINSPILHNITLRMSFCNI